MAKRCPQCQSENPDSSRFCAVCGTDLIRGKKAADEDTKTVAVPTGELKRGSVFAGRYEIIEFLGKGGMGEVYRAEDNQIREEVALKLINPEIAEDKSAIERFRNELKLSRRIAHRNVCKMYYLGEESGTHYITMEYIPGENLKNVIRMSGQLSTGNVIKTITQVCEGLAEAHRLGVLHRDLKPGNIMIDKEGNARIMDFGLARAFRTRKITGTGVAMGTPEYMSPEQIEGKELDQRSDIYSLGIVLYEMATGRVPFDGETPYVVGMKHKHEAPENPRALNPQLPENISRLIMRCLEKEKEKRPEGVEEVLTDLKKIEEELPESQKIELIKKGITGRLSTRLRPVLVPGILLLAALLIIAGYFIYDRFLKPVKPEEGVAQALAPVATSIVVLPFDDLSPDRDNSYFSDGLTEEIITDLSRIQNVRTITRRSASILKSTNKDIPTIGKELNVEYVLEGSVSRVENDFRITVQLMDTAQVKQVWAEKYSGTMEDVFEIQEDLSRSIVEALKLKLTPEENRKIAQRPIDNVLAYDFYLKARQEIWSWSEDALGRAFQNLQRGLNIVGENVLLYAGMGYVYWQYYNAGIKMDEGYLLKVEEYANKIFALDPDSPYGHFLLGLYHTMGNNQESVRHLKRALEKDPLNADALFWLIAVYGHVGKIQAAAPLVGKLLEMDPFNPINHSLPGWLLCFSGQFQLALAPFEKMYQMFPDNPANRGLYAMILIYNSRYEEAFSLIDKIVEDNPEHFFAHLGLFLKYALQGKKKEALQSMTQELQLIAGRDITYSWFIAIGYAILDEREKALDWLENAVKWGFINYPLLSKYDPFLKEIRAEERFQKLMEKVKREWEEFEI